MRLTAAMLAVLLLAVQCTVYDCTCDVFVAGGTVVMDAVTGDPDWLETQCAPCTCTCEVRE